jgi:fatty acid-binding protein DegV
VADGYEKVLAITISSGLSGTFNSVRLVAQDFPMLETFMFDTKNIGIGAGVHAIRAAELIASGSSFNAIAKVLANEVKNSKFSSALQHLNTSKRRAYWPRQLYCRQYAQPQSDYFL